MNCSFFALTDLLPQFHASGKRGVAVWRDVEHRHWPIYNLQQYPLLIILSALGM